MFKANGTRDVHNNKGVTVKQLDYKGEGLLSSSEATREDSVKLAGASSRVGEDL